MRRVGLRRSLRVGLDPRVPAREAKYVILTNAITLIATGLAVGLAILAWATGLDTARWCYAVSAVSFLLVLPLQATGRVLLARAWLALMSAVNIVGGSLLLGPDMHGEAFLLIAVSAAWNLWSSARHALLVTLLFLASYVVLLLLYARIPPIDPPAASIAPVFQVAVFVGTLAGLVGIVGWSHWQTGITDRHLDEEHARSERLLRNVLPDTIAERLKDGPIAVADRFDDVTVLFADIVGFTTLSATLPPERVVDMLNRVFTRFDELAARHRVEKIKTIGDAYMVVAGLPEPRADHAEAAADLALEMRAAIAELSAQVGHDLQVRIGLCTGPAVAGVIGIQKFAYDLWGDTVNTAARMESHGAPGEIHVTESTYLALRDRYQLDERGLIDIKGKGPMPTWFLRARS
jgi:class 3 adenylate cyclase